MGGVWSLYRDFWFFRSLGREFTICRSPRFLEALSICVGVRLLVSFLFMNTSPPFLLKRGLPSKYNWLCLIVAVGLNSVFHGRGDIDSSSLLSSCSLVHSSPSDNDFQLWCSSVSSNISGFSFRCFSCTEVLNDLFAESEIHKWINTRQV